MICMIIFNTKTESSVLYVYNEAYKEHVCLVILESRVTISKSVKKIFFSHSPDIVMKFEHFKGLTLYLEVPQ